MQSTTRLHTRIANPVCYEAYLVFDDPVAFHTAKRVVDPDADGREDTMGRVLWGGSSPLGGFFVGGMRVIPSHLEPWKPRS
jgi:hypothetical protein